MGSRENIGYTIGLSSRGDTKASNEHVPRGDPHHQMASDYSRHQIYNRVPYVLTCGKCRIWMLNAVFRSTASTYRPHTRRGRETARTDVVTCGCGWLQVIWIHYFKQVNVAQGQKLQVGEYEDGRARLEDLPLDGTANS